MSLRDTQNSIVLENGPLLHQPSSYVNYPMMMGDPMIDHQPPPRGLGACTTEPMLMIPPSQNDFNSNSTSGNMVMPPLPMMQPQQPFFLQLPNNPNNSNFLGFNTNNMVGFPPPLFPNMVAPLQHTNASMFNNNAAVPNNTSPTTPEEENKNTTTTAETAPAQQQQDRSLSMDSGAMVPKQQPPLLLQRRRSMMDSILSAFALPNASDIVRPQSISAFVPFKEPARVSNEEEQPTMQESDISTTIVANSPKEVMEIHLNDTASSSKSLQQKIQALQSRHHIWCYQSPKQMWVAFDIKNQNKLDRHYMTLTKSNNTVLEDDVFVLTKQSQVPGPLYISIKSNKAWYHAVPSPIVFDIICLPTENSRFVVPTGTNKPPLKRSKSLDMTVKLLNNLLNW